MKKLSRKNLTILTALVLLAAVLCCAVFGFPPRRIYTARGREPANMEPVASAIAEVGAFEPVSPVIWDFWISDLIAECIVLREIDMSQAIDDPQTDERDIRFFKSVNIYEAKITNIWQGECEEKVITFYVGNGYDVPFSLPKRGDRLVLFLNDKTGRSPYYQYHKQAMYMINPGGKLHAWVDDGVRTVYDGKHLSVLKEDMKKVQEYKDSGAEYHYTLDFL